MLYQRSCLLPPVTTYHNRETNDINWFVQRGYVYVNADVRGTGKSEGIWKFHSEAEQKDHYDLIEWMANNRGRQPSGHDWRVLLGWTQWFAATQQPPHLVTIVPFDAGADMYRDVVYHGGLLGMGFLTWWHFNLRANHIFDRPGPHPPELMTWDMVYEVLNHPTYDTFGERTVDFAHITVLFTASECGTRLVSISEAIFGGFEELNGPKNFLSVGENMSGTRWLFSTPWRYGWRCFAGTITG